MRSTSEQGCAVRVSSLSSLFRQEGITQKYFPINESLFLLIYLVKTVSSLWHAAKINQL